MHRYLAEQVVVSNAMPSGYIFRCAVVNIRIRVSVDALTATVQCMCYSHRHTSSRIPTAAHRKAHLPGISLEKTTCQARYVADVFSKCIQVYNYEFIESILDYFVHSLLFIDIYISSPVHPQYQYFIDVLSNRMQPKF